jgi:hypothetical protein
MNPYDGYQLYQVQRTRTCAEILADEARRGRQAATVLRGSRALPGEASTRGILALNAIRSMTAGRLGATIRGQRRPAAELASPPRQISTPRQIRRVAATDRSRTVSLVPPRGQYS